MPEHDTVTPAYRDILDANARYARSFDKGDLALPPARRIAILTCMDARLDPAKFAGLAEVNAHVIRTSSVAHDVGRIRRHPLVPGHIPIFGFVYDVATGRLDEVAAASEVGRPTAFPPQD